jgi:hypothetical protein
MRGASGSPPMLLRWGMIPYWDKDIEVGFANINGPRPKASRLIGEF